MAVRCRGKPVAARMQELLRIAARCRGMAARCSGKPAVAHRSDHYRGKSQPAMEPALLGLR